MHVPRPLDTNFRKQRQMTLFANMRTLLATSRTFVRDQRGASAIEFAVIVPILLIMYIGTMELGQGIETNKKVARAASMIGDLVTQEQTFTKTELDGILVVGESVLQPYYRSKPTITITAIKIDGAKKATVAWRRKIEAGATSGTGATTETMVVPNQLNVANTFLIKVDTDLNYQPVLTYDPNNKGYGSIFANIPMREGYYLRPRQSPEVSCSDC